MLLTLVRYNKPIAYFFVTVIYTQLVAAPLVVRAQPYVSIARVTATARPVTAPLPGNASFLPAPVVEAVTVTGDKSARVRKAAPVGTAKKSGGPVQPETQSFQSVNTNNMVDLFTGDFSYNIPLLDVGGYPVNLHYQSGITTDQEASWVGLGWNINPGAITRNMRGLPDDYQGVDEVTKTQHMKPNKTIGLTIGGNAELLGASQSKAGGPADSIKGRSAVLGMSFGVLHNTYKGWGTEVGLNANINAGSAAKGPLTGGLALTNNSQEGFDVSPSFGVHISKRESLIRGDVTIGTNFNSRSGIQNLQITGEVTRSHNAERQQRLAGVSHTSVISFAKPSYIPSISLPFTSSQQTYTAKVGTEHWAFHPSGYVRGYLAMQRIEAADTLSSIPAYGYLYFEKAETKQYVLLDFNREKDIAYSENTPHIAIPFYTYDTYSITGEGTGGMFRPYRGDVGYVFDHAMTTKSNSSRLSLDVGFGNIVHGGIDFNKVIATTKNGAWVNGNAFKDITAFRGRDTTFENVYFKNPGEKTTVNSSYLKSIGDEYLVRVDLDPVNDQNRLFVSATRNLSLFKNNQLFERRNIAGALVRKEREKRTQVISYLTAADASVAGLDKIIKSFNINAFPSTSCNTNFRLLKRVDSGRLAHHLSEITVQNNDGRRYVYGIPVYNISQTEVSMSTNKGDAAAGLVSYTPGQDNTTKNDLGKDGYFSKEALPPYSHSFLLTSILSGDYVDLTDDGITEDDPGDAVKFNYSRIYGVRNAYKWRAPYQQNQAAYNEGLKTDRRDEKGSYTYGEREVWYLNSVESKTMIATFVLETDTIRKDGRGVLGENGGRNTAQNLYRLKQINLYTKADFLKNGQANAKPVKSVHFEYSYELCKNHPGSDDNTGKLTLKKVWFSYNKNYKGQKNPYEFTYHALNPDFDQKSVDRWGNYKSGSNNPGTGNNKMTNADYPYVIQDKTAADNNVAAWTLASIKLPSGARINVTYEADDYGYVQNKRAMQLFSIAGFANDPALPLQPNLYKPKNNNNDYHYIFINVPNAVTGKADIGRKYLEGVTSLYCKLAVEMPADIWGSGVEYVPCYAEIEDYGLRANSNNKIIWIKAKTISGQGSPFATAAIQFLRLNLPSKAYPYSEPGDNVDFKAVLGMLATAGSNIANMINGFGGQARLKNRCNSLSLERSFVRLNNPYYRKLGGGLRVKKVEIDDNWQAMTGQRTAVYGQTYDYTKEEMIDGVATRISSGVATYEPVIGNDENPFRIPFRLYSQKVGVLAPVDYSYAEEPFGETFFPAPMVGYSEVRVQTIHKTKKSANGLEQTSFYTSRDFPTLFEITPLDNESKKTYNPPLRNAFRFDAKNYITLSQGFKVELNDMNGKIRSQASYAQDSTQAISYTYYYYKVKNEQALAKSLSNTVAVIDSANGKIDTAAEMGKEVEIMVDVREQVSRTISGSVEVNVDYVHPFPPIVLGSAIPLPSLETNRYRAIAVLKVVNRYGIVDSVIHIEKGSQVTTRNLVYDGQTGDVLLSQTNNEFDDPVYQFKYPAHWAYSGMEGAYKNTGALYTNLVLKQGKLYYDNGKDTFPVHRHFESGDELLVYIKSIRTTYTNDTCAYNYYSYFDVSQPAKIWAISTVKGPTGKPHIYFIDKNGFPVSGIIRQAQIVRSGKRNLTSVAVGSITSLKTPVKTVGNNQFIVFDSSTAVIAADAGRFKDLWQVDSLLYRKDTVMRLLVKAALDSVYLRPSGAYLVKREGRGTKVYQGTTNGEFFETASKDHGATDAWVKTWLRFNLDAVPSGAVVQDASLSLYASPHPDLNQRGSVTNKAYLQRTMGTWIGDALQPFPTSSKAWYDMVGTYFTSQGQGAVETSTRATLSETTAGVAVYRDDIANVTSMATNMHRDYWASNKNYAASIVIDLVDASGSKDGLWNWLSYYSGIPSSPMLSKNYQPPQMKVKYYKPCANGSTPVYASTPQPGYYCYSEPVDTFVCRPIINDTAVNPYRFGILGNWRLDRAFTYYDQREQADPSVATNIRTDGTIKDFKTFWSFATPYVTSNADTSRWVWNSEITKVNSKGSETENHDPLNRYNAGQYGYNRTLPVAVTQNSKQRNSMFEGFEDYDYRTDTCKRCPAPRFIDLTNGGTRVDTTSHTGRYSVRVGGNQTDSAIVAIGTYAQDTVTPKLTLKIDTTLLVSTTVTPKGSGLKAEWKLNAKSGCVPTNVWQLLSPGQTIDYPARPPQICSKDAYNIQWTGKLQPTQTATYTFYARVDDYLTLFVNNRRISYRPNSAYGTNMEQPHNWSEFIASDTITLQAGQLYDFYALYTELSGNDFCQLQWQYGSVRSAIPVANLYSPNMVPADSSGSYRSDTAYCVKARAPRPTQVTLKNFSPLQGTPVVVTAWVKEDGLCSSTGYTNSSVELKFNAGTPSSFVLKPKGPVIEGWQRVEDTLTIPAAATSFTLRLRSLSSSAVFFDDVRIHPFNANMKSFVYDPVNLRLMAELDENNYATFYEYDDDGTLIRVKKETERGIKTIKESRSALQKNN